MVESWKTLNMAVSMIQKAFRRFRFRQGLNKWRSIRSHLKSLVISWRTRRALNCLAQEVTQYVRCEDELRRKKLR